MTEPAFELTEVHFAYAGQEVLAEVTLSMEAGEFAAIVGPNGGGKTTLLKLLLGLLEPARGTVRVLGQSPKRARPRVGYMPQHSREDLRFPVSVRDVVLMGLASRSRWFGPYRRPDRRAAEAALLDVALADLADRSFADLSGGQRQRVLIARAIVGEPDLLLLDEPTSNLDPRVEGELNNLLERLNERMTVVVVSHDVGFAAGHVGKVLCVNRHARIHPTAEITPELIEDLYGPGVRHIRHEHDCIERKCSPEDHA
jgi:zinc transport system ATP-binding protein